ncbi:DUF222 domain-containing protein [Arthrobacter sp. JSM 101049]|uniref:HNH endonuclease signature motif containing protein n=1 Tax=Arthrobacter sp. JSM 101049 TaxID=929097 RepID=UPI00356AEA79
MEEVAESLTVNGWELTRMAGPMVDGSTRLKAAEALVRFAESEKYRAAAMLHDEAQHAVPPWLEALEDHPGMQISVRTGRMASFAAADSAAMEIALVASLSQGQAHRLLGQADTLVSDTPEVLEALTLGRIGASHVQRILEHTRHIVPETPALPPRDADASVREEWEREVAARAAQARVDRRDFGADMLAIAPGKSPSQLRSRGQQVLEKYYGLSFTKRSRTALRDRRITVDEASDGMAWLSGYLPTASCHAIYSKIDGMARLLKADPDSAAAVAQAAREAGNDAAPGTPADNPNEQRTMDQLRADVLIDTVLNGPRGQGLESVNAEVFVTVPSTLFPGTPGGPVAADGTPVDGESSRSNDGADAATGGQAPIATTLTAPGGLSVGELEPGAAVPSLLGGGPIDQISATRLMAAARTWWRVITDPVTGAIVEFGQTRYRPTRAQRAILQFRDACCTTPGCTGPARTCDVDHTDEWQDGGGTDIGNIHFGCRRCHRLKSLGLIEVEQRSGGTILVTSLFGTQRVSYPAAPWAVADPGQASTRQDAPGPRKLPAPPADPDAAIPDVEPQYYHPVQPTSQDEDDDDDPGMTEAEYDAWSAQMLADGDPDAADRPVERALENISEAEILDHMQSEEQEQQGEGLDPDARHPDAPRPDHDVTDEKIEYRHYEALQMRHWGRIEDVPDPSSENPEHGRYARTKHAKANRKRRLKRNAGAYGPPAIRRPDDQENAPEPDSGQAPLEDPPF